MNLFEMNKEIRDIEEQMEIWAAENEGDITNFPLNELLSKYEGDKQQKILNIACWIKEIKAEALAVKAEKDKLAKRQKALENKAERLKSYIESSVSQGEKYKNGRVAISWRKSKAVDIDDEVIDINGLPDDCKKVVVTPNKTNLKKVLESGVRIAGAHIVTNHSLQIK